MNDVPDNRSFLPYGRQLIDEADEQAVLDVLRGDWLTTGPAVEAYERAFAERVGARHAIACSSGTAGLHMAAIALDLDFGDIVVVPSVTFLATANAARYVKADVLFADVDPETGVMRLEDVQRAIAGMSKGTVKAIFPVHLTGHTVNLDELAAEFPELVLIEDACHALGAEYEIDGSMVPVGSCPHGGITMFSTHPVKTIATGEGGMLTTNSDRFADSLRRSRNHGLVREPESFLNKRMGFEDGVPAPWYYEMHEPGYNYRLSDINAALGLSQLGKLDAFVSKRRALRARYQELLDALGPHVAMQKVAPGCNPAWHLAVALIDFAALGTTRTAVMTALKERGIGTQVHYIPVHRQPYYANRYQAKSLPGADAYYARCLSLPLFPAMSEGDVERVVEELTEVLGI